MKNKLERKEKYMYWLSNTLYKGICVETLIKIRELKKYYNVGKKKFDAGHTAIRQPVLKALDDVSFDIYKGEIFGVVGESGCGKSTLGRCIMKLTDITEGKIFFKGEDIVDYNFKQMVHIRKQMQMVFQNPFSSFNPKQTIGKNLSEVAKFYRMPTEEYKEKIKNLVEYIGLDENVLKRHPNELSGGQLQRLAIIRALILNPEFIMADEPVSALDVSVQAQILNLILDLKDKFGLTMMFISHELTVVKHICDRVAVMYLGNIVELASSEQLFSHAFHPYTAALISAKPKELPEQETKRIHLKGDVPSAMDIPQGCRFHTRCPYAKQGKCDFEIPRLNEIQPGHFVACHFPI